MCAGLNERRRTGEISIEGMTAVKGGEIEGRSGVQREARRQRDNGGHGDDVVTGEPSGRLIAGAEDEAGVAFAALKERNRFPSDGHDDQGRPAVGHVDLIGSIQALRTCGGEGAVLDKHRPIEDVCRCVVPSEITGTFLDQIAFAVSRKELA